MTSLLIWLNYYLCPSRPQKRKRYVVFIFVPNNISFGFLWSWRAKILTNKNRPFICIVSLHMQAHNGNWLLFSMIRDKLTPKVLLFFLSPETFITNKIVEYIITCIIYIFVSKRTIPDWLCILE